MGTPQDGVLLSLFLMAGLNDLLEELGKKGCRVITYVDKVTGELNANSSKTELSH